MCVCGGVQLPGIECVFCHFHSSSALVFSNSAFMFMLYSICAT